MDFKLILAIYKESSIVSSYTANYKWPKILSVNIFPSMEWICQCFAFCAVATVNVNYVYMLCVSMITSVLRNYIAWKYIGDFCIKFIHNSYCSDASQVKDSQVLSNSL